MNEVEIRFTGEPSDAQSAAAAIDVALEQIKKIADMVSDALGDITIGRGQVSEVQAGGRAISAALKDVHREASQAAEAVHDVKFGAGQAAGVVAEAAVISAALDRIDASAQQANRHVNEIGRFQPGSMMAAFASGQSMSTLRRTFEGPPAGAGPGGIAYNSSGYGMTTIGPSPTDMGMRYNRPNYVDPRQYLAPIGPEFRRVVGDTGIASGGRIGAYDMGLGPYGTGPDPRRSSRFFSDVPDALSPRYGNLGVLSSSSERGRGGLLGYLFGARGGNDGGSRIADILGGGSGGSVARRFGGFGGGGGGMFGNLSSIVPGGGRATGPAFAAAVGIAGTAASDVAPGVVGLLAPIASLGASGVATIGSLVIAFQGLGKAIGGDQKAFDALTPSAQQFVQTVRQLEPWADKMQQVVRSNLFPGIEKALHSALSPGTTTTIERILGQGARGTGAGAAVFGQFLGSDKFQQELGGIGNMVEQDIPKWADIVAHFASTVLGLVNAFRPLSVWAVDGIEKFSALADTWVQNTSAVHGFDSTIEAAKNGLRDAWLLLKSLGDAVFSLGEVLKPAGHEMIVLVSEGLEGLSHWLDEHRTEIQDVLVNSFDILGKTLHIIVPVIGIAADGLLALADAVTKLGDGMGALPAVIAGVVGALVLMSKNPEIKALLVAMAALGYLTAGGGTADNSSIPGGTTDVSDIKGTRLKNAREVIALRKKGWSDANIQSYLNGDSDMGNKFLKPLPGFPQFGKGPSGDIAMASAFTDANALTTGQGAKGGVMPATSEAGNAASTLLQGPHHTDGFPGSGRTAVDIAARVGAPVLAPEDGSVTRDSGSAPKSGSNNINGYSLYYQGASGTNYFMTHMSWVAKPGAYKKGDRIGVVAAGTQGGPHIHVDYDPPVSMMGGKGNPTGGSNPFGPDQPFSGSSKAFELPTGMQTALAQAQNAYLLAQGTGTKKDDAPAIAAYRAQIAKAEAYLRAKIKTLKDPNDILLATQELGSLISTMNSVGAYVKRGIKKPASLASRLAGQNAGHSVLDMIGQALGPTSGLLKGLVSSPADILTATPLADAHAKYDSSLKAWRQQINAFERELRDKTISKEAVATIKARITTIKKDVSGALSDIKDAARLQAENFKSVWETYVTSFDDTFRQTTSDVLAHPEKYPMILPLSAALADLQDSHTQQQLQKALTDAQKQLADALSGTTDPNGALARARDALGKDALAHALDVAQSVVLGGTPMDMTQKIIEDMQQALADAGVPDPKAVEDAQQAVEDAKYNIKVDGLSKQASAEQEAYQDSRTELQKHLDAALAQWETYYAKSGMTAADALKSLNALLVKFGFAPVTDVFNPSTGDFETPGSGGGSGGSSASGGSIVRGGTAAGRQSIADQLAAGQRPIINPGTIVGMASGGLVTSPHYLVDMHGVVRGMVGEGSTPELIAPVSPPSSGGAGGRLRGGDGVTVNLQFADGMQWLEQFVTVQVKKQTPSTSRAIGIAADRRRREGRHA